jgi:zinc/manganese transport system substrate-binding protein
MTLLVALISAGSLLSTPDAAHARQIHAIATFSVLGDVVKEIGGDKVDVTVLVGPDRSPHTFEPSPRDAANLKSSDLVFVSGFGLEGWLDRFITASGYTGKVVTASNGISTVDRERRGSMSRDPHVWNNPLNVVVWAGNIRSALAEADPEDATQFSANAERYIKQLQALDADARAAIGSIPAARRKVLTSHDAFGYFANAYGVKFMAPQGLSTASEASAKDVGEIVRQIKAQDIKVYFIENADDPRLVQSIAEQTGAKPGGELYPEALSAPDGPAPTYLKMFRYNLDELVAAMKK